MLHLELMWEFWIENALLLLNSQKLLKETLRVQFIGRFLQSLKPDYCCHHSTVVTRAVN